MRAAAKCSAGDSTCGGRLFCETSLASVIRGVGISFLIESGSMQSVATHLVVQSPDADPECIGSAFPVVLGGGEGGGYRFLLGGFHRVR